MLRNRVCLFVLIVVFCNSCWFVSSPEVWGRSGIVQPQGLAIVGYDVSGCQRPQYNLGFYIQVLFHSRPSCVPSSSSGLRRSRARRPRLVTVIWKVFVWSVKDHQSRVYFQEGHCLVWSAELCQQRMDIVLTMPTPRKLRFAAAVRSPPFWVSGYCKKWRIQDRSYPPRIHACSTSKRSQETEHLASTLSDNVVECICRNIQY